MGSLPQSHQGSPATVFKLYSGSSFKPRLCFIHFHVTHMSAEGTPFIRWTEHRLPSCVHILELGGWATTPSWDSCKSLGVRTYCHFWSWLPALWPLPSLASLPHDCFFTWPCSSPKVDPNSFPMSPPKATRMSLLCIDNLEGWQFQEEEWWITEIDKLQSILIILLWKNPLAMAPMEVFHSI